MRKLKSYLLSVILCLFCSIAYATCEISIDGNCYLDADVIQFEGLGSAPATSISGQAVQYFDPVTGKLQCSEDGGAFADCVGGGGSLSELDDVNSATVTAGRLLISNGSHFNSATIDDLEEDSGFASGDFLMFWDSGSNALNKVDYDDLPGAGTGATKLTELSDVNSATATAGRLLAANGSDFNSIEMTGDCTISSSGVIDCSGGSVSELTDLDDVNSSTVTTGRILITNNSSFNSVAMSGDVTITSAGVTSLATGSVTNNELLDFNSVTKTAGRLFVANGSNFNSVALAVRPGTTYTVCASGSKDNNICDYQCDGTADDVQIQAAIDALDADGGTVQLTEGTYTLAATVAITPDANQPIHLRGLGLGSIITRVNSMNADAITVTGVNANFWEISNLHMIGNKANNTSGSAINITSDVGGDIMANISNVYITSFDEDGIELASGITINELHLNNVRSYLNDGHGFNLNAAASGDFKIANCVAGTNVKDGFYVNIGTSQFSNTKAFGNGSASDGAGTDYYGFRILATGNQLTGVQAQDNYTDGIYVDASNTAIVGSLCDANNNGGTVAGTYAGIHLLDDADYGTVTGNVLKDRNGTPHQDYGLIVDSGAIDNNIGGNSFLNNATGETSIGTTELNTNFYTIQTDFKIKNIAPRIVLDDTDGGATRPSIEHDSDLIYIAGDDAGGGTTSFHFAGDFSNARDDDAMLKIMGSAADSWATWLQIGHDGTDGIITTDAGDIKISANGGDVDFADDNITTTGTIAGTTLTEGGNAVPNATDVISFFSDVNSATVTAGRILMTNGSHFNSATINDLVEDSGFTSGDFMMFWDTGSGTMDKVDYDNLPSGGASALSGLSDVNSSTPTAGRFLVANGSTFNSVGMTGDVTITSAGATSLAANSVTANELVDFNSVTKTAGRMFVANGSTFNSVAISGAGAMASDGALTVTTTDVKCIYWEDPTADDDFKSIWTANGFAATITKMWCESDQTVNADLQVDDGSPADVDGTDLVCDSTPAEDESLAGDATMADGDRLDMAVTSVSGTPTWVSFCWTYTIEE